MAFMSYVRFDDQHENGRLTEFCQRLSGEVRMQTGEEFPIFQDRNDIQWGQNWKRRVVDSVDEATFLIPIITPNFFQSPACRDELTQFIEREKQLGRDDLILPVYYVECRLLNDPNRLADDDLAQVIASRQRADWRELRFEPLTLPDVGRMFAKMAVQISDALDRVGESQPAGRSAAPTIDKNSPVSEPEPVSDLAESLAQMAEAGQGPSPKTEPPTRIVDPMGRADHITISEAIQAANPGDRIMVRPGLYQEGIVIDKPLEIIGDGPRDDIVVQASGTVAIQFRTAMGRVSNLSLHQTGGDKGSCVNIFQGRLLLEDCDITSENLIGVHISEGADPRLLRNRIHSCKKFGVIVSGDGMGTLEANEIFENEGSGVVITTGGNPTLRRNRIHDGKRGGVLALKNARGVLEDNDIIANAGNGVSISEGGTTILRGNRINQNGRYGVRINDSGGGTIEDNDLRDNTWGPWNISEDSEPLLKRARNLED